jgi:hypothetical protein
MDQQQRWALTELKKLGLWGYHPFQVVAFDRFTSRANSFSDRFTSRANSALTEVQNLGLWGCRPALQPPWRQPRGK